MIPRLRMQQLIRPFFKRFERLVYSTYPYEYEGRYQQPSALLEHTIVQSNSQLASCRFTLAEKSYRIARLKKVSQSVSFILLHISATQERKGFYSCALETTIKTCA